MKVEIPDRMWRRLVEEIEGNDYCSLCDHHPSSGHNEDCPLAKPKPTRIHTEEQCGGVQPNKGGSR